MQQVVFIANSLDNAFTFQDVLGRFDVNITAGSTTRAEKMVSEACDLVVFEACGSALRQLEDIKVLCSKCGCRLLAIIDEGDLEGVRYPTDIVFDFIVNGASRAECAVRIGRLLGEGGDGSVSDADLVTVGSMTINLATYQVHVAGTPVDFTYLEYALLAFLACHPRRTFSRDELLQHVWGFDYYGGSRTVDVHVRRIRAKLGPDLAQHLSTVRGVGYLWNP